MQESPGFGDEGTQSGRLCPNKLMRLVCGSEVTTEDTTRKSPVRRTEAGRLLCKVRQRLGRCLSGVRRFESGPTQ